MKQKKRVVIIGGNACGMKTAARLRRRDSDAEIMVFEKGSFISYGSCGFPYYISGAVKDYQSLIGGAGSVRDEAYFDSVKGVKVTTGREVTGIDRENKEVEVLDLSSGDSSRQSYDTLVIATGGIPSRPVIEGPDDIEGVFTVASMDDIIAIREHIDNNGVQNVIISGGGFIGVEVAEALKEKGLCVTIIKKSDKILPSLFDEEMSLLIAKHMELKGVRIIVGDAVTGMRADDKGCLKSVVTEKGEELPAGILLVTKGFLPNAGLAKAAGLELGESGAIRVNANMQTTDPDIYAGGDCVECTHLVTGKKMTLALGSLANLQGRVIADNIAGDDAVFPAVPGTAIFKIFDYTASRTGITEKEAKDLGYEYISVIVPGPDKPGFYPGAKPVVTKLIADKKTRKILGVQILGPGEAAKRMEIAATALTCNASVDMLSMLNLAYSPPYSPPMDNIINAANAVINKLKGLAEGRSPIEVMKKFKAGDDFIFLDVRTESEFSRMRIDHPKVMPMPLGKLRSEGGSLRKDKEIVVSCVSSLRAYEGCIILKAMGYEKVSFMDGGLLAWPYPLSI